ncbi:hypothetical protein CXF86_19095 [Shewanella sp. GutCb]|uniref:hypothetical protein n=1 Tax=Shewanella sp. GutCb TaxID=2058315 RepID=UPI000C79F465|nr:hypothetical protein [Shewanella sp. GutCb]PKG73158.1 hypothetical protein CXF86_19095 [Shewanella sp. GutCb]
MKTSPETKNKSLYYRRANFGILTAQNTLQKMLINCLDATETVGSRTFAGGQGTEIRCSNEKDDSKGLYLQITTYTPGQATSTIEKDRKRKLSIVDEEDAPIGKDFVDGEGFVFVNGNNIIICMSNARESLISKYFKALLESQNYVQEATNLELEIVANIDRLKMIKKEGVKEFTLGCSLYDASLQRLRNKDSHISSVLGKIVDQFESVFSNDDTLKDIDDKENLDIKVSISFDGMAARTKENKKIEGYGESGKARLLASAESLLNDEDAPEFTIVTGNGNVITPELIRVSDTKKINTLGKSLMKGDAWSKLYLYYSELKADGILEQ